MQKANKAIKRKKHVIPTINDIIAQANDAIAFSKLNQKQSYHRMLLGETFATHVDFSNIAD